MMQGGCVKQLTLKHISVIVGMLPMGSAEMIFAYPTVHRQLQLYATKHLSKKHMAELSIAFT
eukprot:c41270_g1_i1 orf=21-206(-)